jgi:hypothetical protein
LVHLSAMGFAALNPSYVLGLARYGMDGSIRTDVVLGDDDNKIIAIYDVKTGGATMRPARAVEIREYTKVGPDVSIFILHAVKGISNR